MRATTLLGVGCAALASIAADAAAQSLTTMFQSNNGGAVGGAVYFDLAVHQPSVAITALDLNCAAQPGTPVGVQVYITPNSAAGQEANPGAWTQLGVDDGTAVAAGVDLPTLCQLQNAVVLNQGSYGVALVAVNTGHRYTNGANLFSDPALSLNLGTASNAPFAAPTFVPRTWNGTVHYSTVSVANDECAGALPVFVGWNGPWSNQAATTSAPPWSCGQGQNDLWFVYQATCTGLLQVDTCTGSSFDTTLEVFAGGCGALTLLACNDDACGLQSRVTVPVTAGQVCHVRVGGYQGLTGSFGLALACPAPNPAPVLAAIAPTSAPAGSPALTLSLHGSGFVAASVARWNGVPLATTWFSGNLLTAAVPAAQLQQPGPVVVTVANPGPGGGVSAGRSFTITPPPAAIHSVAPPVVLRDSGPFTLDVRGTDFVPGDTVRWDGAALATTFAHGSLLRAQVPAALVAAAGRRAITVQSPGGAITQVRRILVAAPHAFELHSVDDNDVAADDDSRHPVVSMDGRFVAFASRATNLVPGDGNQRWDIFVRDRVERRTTRVSVGPGGSEANGDSLRASISGDGRYVAFTSLATNLGGAASPHPQVYRIDRDSDDDGLFDEVDGIRIELLSMGLIGVAADAPCQITSQAISEDGRRVCFATAATNLVAQPTAGLTHCYVRDLGSSITFRASTGAGGTPANGSSHAPAISGDGNYLVFETDATNLFAGDGNGRRDVVRKILASMSQGAVDLVSRASGAAGAQGNGASGNGAISRTGQWVAFTTEATNLGGNDGNAAADVYRRDFGNDVTLLISFGRSGATANGASHSPAITPTGCTMFVSLGSDFWASDTNLSPDVHAWSQPNLETLPATMYNYPAGVIGSGSSGLHGIGVAESASLVVYSSTAANLAMGVTAAVLSFEFIGSLVAPLVAPAAPGPDDNPVTFSVDGPVDQQTKGLALARGTGAALPFGVRLPEQAQALGVPTARPGDVNDYLLAGLPSEAELFQSEPDPPPAAPPSGTNNQIVVADESGLVAGRPAATYCDNVDAFSFGEDYFGVRGVSPAPTPAVAPWALRTGSFVEPVVTLDIGTSFRFGVDPFALGGPVTAVLAESGGADAGAGLGPWTSPGEAAGDVFGTPVLMRPAPPPPGLNVLVHDQLGLGLAGPVPPPTGREDDLDALECVGDNDPSSWVPGAPGPIQPGNLRGRVTEAIPGLALPGVAHHVVAPVPVLFSVDRRSTGLALSAVRTQSLSAEAAADVFMALGGTNYLLLDESELGLNPGSGGDRTDELDALVLLVHPGDRARLLALAALAASQATVVDPTPGMPGSGDEYRVGAGFTTSLVRLAWQLGTPLRIRVGFSVSTDSIGLRGTAVDYEAGLKPLMEQAGDIYFTQFGTWDDAPEIANPAPASLNGVHWLWYQEVEIGLVTGGWTLPAVPGRSLAVLPDELNALDTLCTAPGRGGSYHTYGSPCPGSGGYAPILTPQGWPRIGESVAFSVHGGLGGSLAFFVFGAQPGTYTLPGFSPNWPFYLDPARILSIQSLGLGGVGPGAGTTVLRFRLPPTLQPFSLALQTLVLDPNGVTGIGFATSNGALVRFQ